MGGLQFCLLHTGVIDVAGWAGGAGVCTAMRCMGVPCTVVDPRSVLPCELCGCHMLNPAGDHSQVCSLPCCTARPVTTKSRKQMGGDAGMCSGDRRPPKPTKEQMRLPAEGAHAPLASLRAIKSSWRQNSWPATGSPGCECTGSKGAP